MFLVSNDIRKSYLKHMHACIHTYLHKLLSKHSCKSEANTQQFGHISALGKQNLKTSPTETLVLQPLCTATLHACSYKPYRCASSIKGSQVNTNDRKWAKKYHVGFKIDFIQNAIFTN